MHTKIWAKKRVSFFRTPYTRLFYFFASTSDPKSSVPTSVSEVRTGHGIRIIIKNKNVRSLLHQIHHPLLSLVARLW